MQDVQVVGPVLREDGCDERIGDGFEGSVRVGEDEHPEFEVIVRVFWGGCEECHDG